MTACVETAGAPDLTTDDVNVLATESARMISAHQADVGQSPVVSTGVEASEQQSTFDPNAAPYIPVDAQVQPQYMYPMYPVNGVPMAVPVNVPYQPIGPYYQPMYMGPAQMAGYPYQYDPHYPMETPPMSPKRRHSKGKGSRPRSRTASSSSDGAAQEALSDDISIAHWLRLIRLHKYTSVLEGLTRQDLLVMSDEDLEKYPITDGARRKLRIEIARWANFKGLDVPFEIPPSKSNLHSRGASASTSLSGSRPDSRGSFKDPKLDLSATPEQLLSAVTRAAEEMKIAEDETKDEEEGKDEGTQ